MINPNSALTSLGNDELLASTRAILRRGCVVEADLLLHLAEIEERSLYLKMASSSMFAFCVSELGFSEDQAYSRIAVAHAGKRFPCVVESLRSGKVHLTGLRLLGPHLTEHNHRDVLAQSAGKSKRQIEELVAKLAPQPPVPTMIRRLPQPVQTLLVTDGVTLPRRVERPTVAPLSEDTFKVQFTASRAFRDKLRQAQGLLRHRVPSGDVAAILEKAVDLLLEKVTKERFAAGRKPRKELPPKEAPASSRHVPAAAARHVYSRDEGRCAFVDERGKRCEETGMLELDHIDGFAETRSHDKERIRLLCWAHNQHLAEQRYGREFMERARALRKSTVVPERDAMR
jgi:hypothetical protein